MSFVNPMFLYLSSLWRLLSFLILLEQICIQCILLGALKNSIYVTRTRILSACNFEILTLVHLLQTYSLLISQIESNKTRFIKNLETNSLLLEVLLPMRLSWGYFHLVLAQGRRAYHICLDLRDWQSGNFIASLWLINVSLK